MQAECRRACSYAEAPPIFYESFVYLQSDTVTTLTVNLLSGCELLSKVLYICSLIQSHDSGELGQLVVNCFQKFCIYSYDICIGVDNFFSE